MGVSRHWRLVRKLISLVIEGGDCNCNTKSSRGIKGHIYVIGGFSIQNLPRVNNAIVFSPPLWRQQFELF